MTEQADTAVRLRMQRGDAALGRIAAAWRTRWGRRLMIALATLLVAIGLFWFIFARDLPDAATLADYQPPLPTIVRDVNGQPIHSYARERRVQLQFSDYPPQLIRAYLAAEDKTFFSHSGVDIPGLVGAVFDYVSKIGSGDRARGGSTITQQVAKNLLIGDEYSPTRKIKEMILAYRIEQVLTKEQILELYLNQIFLGRNAYGVQAASRAYFDKDVGDLQLHEMAYLAILPKGPANYRPERYMDRAIERRNWALGEMRENDWITDAQLAAARAMPLGTVRQRPSPYGATGGYYIEEVRRRLIDQFGESDRDGPNSIYAGGLWVRTPLNTAYQQHVTYALRAGLLRYDAGKGWSGPVTTLQIGGGWQRELAASGLSVDYADWQVAVVVDKTAGNATLGLSDGTTGILPSGSATLIDRRVGGTAFDAMKPGDVIVVRPEGNNRYALRNVPGVSGGMVLQDARSGRIYALQGGFDSRLSSYNRATQAQRQPGSTIKPFVYAAALDNGMTPASIIVDGPFCVYQSAKLGQKCFRNFGGGGAGSQTLRWAVEQSRNLMTVRAASQTGMERVSRTIKAMGIGDYPPYLAIALGSGETTVEKLTNAYSMLVNHGRTLTPRVIDYVQDRSGKVIWPAQWRPCDGCNAADWNGAPMPRAPVEGKQAMNPMTAYQIVHIGEGVIQRGTATVLRDLDRPLFGKTGTTTGPTNVWFVGGSPELVAGVYIGYDKVRSLGSYAQGGSITAPIWKQAMKPILDPMPKTPFIAPAGVRMVRIDRRSGKRVYGGWPSKDPKSAIIWEAFKPETEPRRSIRTEELVERSKGERRSGGGQSRSSDFAGDQGGIY